VTRPSYEATSNASVPPVPPEPGGDDGDLVTVFVAAGGIRTSDGPGPGVRHVSPAEAAWLIQMRYAVAGETPPRGFNL
jgi:hypothetical protein